MPYSPASGFDLRLMVYLFMPSRKVPLSKNSSKNSGASPSDAAIARRSLSPFRVHSAMYRSHADLKPGSSASGGKGVRPWLSGMSSRPTWYVSRASLRKLGSRFGALYPGPLPGTARPSYL